MTKLNNLIKFKFNSFFYILYLNASKRLSELNSKICLMNYVIKIIIYPVLNS